MRLLHVRKNVSKRPVLVYDGEISPRVEADGYFAALIPARDGEISPRVEADGYFAALIPARKLLGL